MATLELNRNLSELKRIARENVLRMQRCYVSELVPHGRAAHSTSEAQILGESFRDLENEIAALQISASSDVKNNDNNSDVPITSGFAAGYSSEAALCAALRERYANIHSALVDDVLNDVFRASATQSWDEAMNEWGSSLRHHERHLDMKTNMPDIEESGSGDLDRAISSVSNDVLNRWSSPAVAATLRLTLNLVNKNPTERSASAMQEIVSLCCEIVAAVSCSLGLAQATHELWMAILTLCKGFPPKDEEFRSSPFNEDDDVILGVVLRKAIRNALRRLEVACRDQVLQQIGLDPSGSDILPATTLAAQLRSFCFPEGSTRNGDLTASEQYWRLTYWAARCGAVEVLGLLEAQWSGILKRDGCLFVSSPAEPAIRRAEEDLLIGVISALQEKLRDGIVTQDMRKIEDALEVLRLGPSNNARYNNSSSWRGVGGTQSTAGHPGLTPSAHYDHSVVSTTIEVHPIIPLLLNIISQDNRSTGSSLLSFMPAASVEDFLWYDLHKAVLRRPGVAACAEAIIQLRRKLMSAGPSHFDSSAHQLSFAKLALLTFAPAVAFHWLACQHPSLIGIWLMMATILQQHELLSIEDTLFVALSPPDTFVRCNQNVSSVAACESLASLFKLYLTAGGASSFAARSPETVFQLCELLPFEDRQSVVNGILPLCTPVLLASDNLQLRVIGSISADGSCRGGHLYRCFVVPCFWKKQTSLQENGRAIFHEVLASLTEQAKQEGELLAATRFAFLGPNDILCLELLHALSVDPFVFPSDTPLEHPADQARQRDALTLISIYTSRLDTDELSPDALDLAKQLRLARKCTTIYRMAAERRWKTTWNLLTSKEVERGVELSVFPSIETLQQWAQTALKAHLPRLVHVACSCLLTEIEVPRAEGQPLLTPEEIDDYAAALLDSCAELERSSSLSGDSIAAHPDTVRLLRRITTRKVPSRF